MLEFEFFKDVSYKTNSNLKTLEIELKERESLIILPRIRIPLPHEIARGARRPWPHEIAKGWSNHAL